MEAPARTRVSPAKIVAVVGGGIVGETAARHLTQNEHFEKILVLDNKGFNYNRREKRLHRNIAPSTKAAGIIGSGMPRGSETMHAVKHWFPFSFYEHMDYRAMYPHIYTPTLMHVAYAFKGSRSSGVLPREKLPGWLKGAVSAFDPNKNEGHDYYLCDTEVLQRQLKYNLEHGAHGKEVEFVHAELLSLEHLPVTHTLNTCGVPLTRLRVRYLDAARCGRTDDVIVRAVTLAMGDGTFEQPGVREFIENKTGVPLGTYDVEGEPMCYFGYALSNVPMKDFEHVPSLYLFPGHEDAYELYFRSDGVLYTHWLLKLSTLQQEEIARGDRKHVDFLDAEVTRTFNEVVLRHISHEYVGFQFDPQRVVFSGVCEYPVLRYNKRPVDEPLLQFVGDARYLTVVITGTGHRGIQLGPGCARIAAELVRCASAGVAPEFLPTVNEVIEWITAGVDVLEEARYRASALSVLEQSEHKRWQQRRDQELALARSENELPHGRVTRTKGAQRPPLRRVPVRYAFEQHTHLERAAPYPRSAHAAVAAPPTSAALQSWVDAEWKVVPVEYARHLTPERKAAIEREQQRRRETQTRLPLKHREASSDDDDARHTNSTRARPGEPVDSASNTALSAADAAVCELLFAAYTLPHVLRPVPWPLNAPPPLALLPAPLAAPPPVLCMPGTAQLPPEPRSQSELALPHLRAPVSSATRSLDLVSLAPHGRLLTTPQPRDTPVIPSSIARLPATFTFRPLPQHDTSQMSSAPQPRALANTSLSSFLNSAPEPALSAPARTAAPPAHATSDSGSSGPDPTAAASARPVATLEEASADTGTHKRRSRDAAWREDDVPAEEMAMSVVDSRADSALRPRKRPRLFTEPLSSSGQVVARIPVVKALPSLAHEIVVDIGDGDGDGDALRS